MQANPKKIAVLIERQASDGIRAAAGMAVLNDEVGVYFVGPGVGRDALDPIAMENLEALGLMDVPVYSTDPASSFRQISPEDMACAIIEYDVVLTF